MASFFHPKLIYSAILKAEWLGSLLYILNQDKIKDTDGSSWMHLPFFALIGAHLMRLSLALESYRVFAPVAFKDVKCISKGRTAKLI